MPAARSFLVLGLHVGARLAHGLDDLVQRHVVSAVAAHRHARHVDGLGGANRVSFDARYLHQAAHRIAGEPEVMLHRNLGRVFHLRRRAAHHGREAGGGHRARDAHLALAADLRAGD